MYIKVTGWVKDEEFVKDVQQYGVLYVLPEGLYVPF
jgi:hypothetical protein